MGGKDEDETLLRYASPKKKPLAFILYSDYVEQPFRLLPRYPGMFLLSCFWHAEVPAI